MPYSLGYIEVRDCVGTSCTTPYLDQQYGYDQNVAMSGGVAGKADASLMALPGQSALTGLPVLKSKSSATGSFTSVSFVLAFQGYQNTSSQTLQLAFAGDVDFTASGGSGVVRPTIAVLSDAVKDPSIGLQWLATDNLGGFIANCNTAGAMAVVNGAPNFGRGTGAVSVDTSTGGCNGQPTFSIAPGQQFYVLARLLTAQAGSGSTDAFNTFNVDFSPLVPQSERAFITSALKPIALAAVPEPATWAMMILGFALTGVSLRGAQPGRRKRFTSSPTTARPM